MNHLQVAVLRGGPNEAYSISMKSGAAVIESLLKSNYRVKDIIVTKQGEWLEDGVVKNPELVLKSVDLAFIALHGEYAEDGQVQKILQRHNIPFTGSNSFSSAIAFNKDLTKKTLSPYGVLMPESKLITKDDESSLDSIAKEITDSFGPEYIIKPAKNGSSLGIKLVRAGENLTKAIEGSLETYDDILVEEFIRGREASCATLENFRNDLIYVFPSIEVIVSRDHQFYNTTAKTDSSSLEICPATFSYGERAKIAEITALAHQALHLSQYSRSDFIINKNGVYFLEVNTLPSLGSESLYPKTAAAVGLKFDDLVVHLIQTATR